MGPDSLRGRSLAFPYGERRENASFAMFGLVDFEVVCVGRGDITRDGADEAFSCFVRENAPVKDAFVNYLQIGGSLLTSLSLRERFHTRNCQGSIAKLINKSGSPPIFSFLTLRASVQTLFTFSLGLFCALNQLLVPEIHAYASSPTRTRLD